MLSRTSKKAFKFRILIVNNQTEYMIQWHLDEYMVFYNGSRTTRKILNFIKKKSAKSYSTKVNEMPFFHHRQKKKMQCCAVDEWVKCYEE